MSGIKGYMQHIHQTIKVNSTDELPIKRFYLPVETSIECPNCGTRFGKDFAKQYLSYPVLDKVEHHYTVCPVCEKEFNVDLTLSMSVDIVGTSEV